jgi:hypothetical protein
MKNEPNSFWRKPRRGPVSYWLAWLVLMLAALVIFVGIAWAANMPFTHEEFGLLLYFEIFITISIGLVIFIRWLISIGWRRILFALACLATLIALFYAEEDWRGWHTWNQFKTEWAAKGEKFDMAGVAPPPVPDNQNFALAPIWVESIKAILGPQRAQQWFGNHYAENGRTNFSDRLALNITRQNDWANAPANGSWAKASLTVLESWQAYYRALVQTNRHSVIVTNEFPIAPQPQSPAADVLLALSKYDSVIEELRAASQLPDSRFPLNYDSESPAAILLPHLSELKRCAQVLQLRAIAELQNGQSDQALADVKLLLRLTDAVRTEPFLISHLVRLAMFQITLQPVWEGLAEHKWSDAQLAALETELAKFDFLAGYRFAMRGEMGYFGAALDSLRRHPEDLQTVESYDNENQTYKFPGRFIAHLIPSGWFYQNQFRIARLRVLYSLPLANETNGTFVPGLVRLGKAAWTADTKTLNPYNALERLENPWLGEHAPKFAYGQASVDLARTAVALERYRLAHGEFPEALAALAPQFIAAVPHDVIGGGPLHYRRTPDGQFILYSIGWNETDDGGVVVFKNGASSRDEMRSVADTNQGDWVWRYPQK